MTVATRALRVLIALLVCLPGVARAGTIGAGFENTVLLAPDGTVWAWGRNTVGQLGDGTGATHLVPTPVPGLTNIVAISSTTYHTVALASDGTVWAVHECCAR